MLMMLPYPDYASPSGWFHALVCSTIVVQSMKRKDLERELKDAGWWFLRHGGNHDTWTNGHEIEQIPRHREIGENLAKKIVRRAKQSPEKGGQMILEAKIEKDGKFLSVDFAALDAGTQGHDLKELLRMAKDLVKEFCDRPAVISVSLSAAKVVEVEVSPSSAIIPAILRRQREKSGLSSREVTARLGEKSPSSYSSYELGKRVPSAEKLDELLDAVSKHDKLKIRVG